MGELRKKEIFWYIGFSIALIIIIIGIIISGIIIPTIFNAPNVQSRINVIGIYLIVLGAMGLGIFYYAINMKLKKIEGITIANK